MLGRNWSPFPWRRAGEQGEAMLRATEAWHWSKRRNHHLYCLTVSDRLASGKTPSFSLCADSARIPDVF